MPTIRKTAVFLSALLLSAAALAAPPSDAAIEELLALTKMEQTVSTMLQGMDQELATSMRSMLSEQKLSDAERAKMDVIFQKTGQILREEMAWSKMRPIYVQIYRESLTDEDLAGMLAFYKTPAGQAMIEKMPIIVKKSMDITREQVMPRMVRRMQDMQKEMAQALREKKK